MQFTERCITREWGHVVRETRKLTHLAAVRPIDECVAPYERHLADALNSGAPEKACGSRAVPSATLFVQPGVSISRLVPQPPWILTVVGLKCLRRTFTRPSDLSAENAGTTGRRPRFASAAGRGSRGTRRPIARVAGCDQLCQSDDVVFPAFLPSDARQRRTIRLDFPALAASGSAAVR